LVLSIELTEEMRQALAAQRPPGPLRFTDPRTNVSYVLLPAAIYDQFKELLEEAEDQALQKAWLEMSRKSAMAWMKENPY
jgi:hypothetical protein